MIESMINNILYIVILCVYSVVLIVITLKSPLYMFKIRQYFKSRKKQKQSKFKRLVRSLVREYLKEIHNG